MPLNKQQQKLVEDNMNLVGTVIKENVRDVNNLGIYTYHDIFQIGCVGLTMAALSYTPGRAEFSTCAYIFIRNEIFNALDRATVRRKNEFFADTETVLSMTNSYEDVHDYAFELGNLLDAAKERTTGVTAKGIDAIKFMAEGYTCREIGEMMGGVTANNVAAWVSKARAYLKKDPNIMVYIEQV